jgi:selenide,water dikinase
LLDGIGEGVGMDCSIVPAKRYPDMKVISTTDFFFPLVEDPYLQGRIACCNVLSDMYALGVVDVDNVLMLIAASLDMPGAARLLVTKEMMRGFNDQARAADTAVTGGQSVLNPWPRTISLLAFFFLSSSESVAASSLLVLVPGSLF